jgi:protein tyrosine phosphatase
VIGCFILASIHAVDASNYILVGDGEKRDYFNASSINTYSQQHAFIATQYPLPNTVTHLLDVIYQRKCKTCVVLCHDAELGSSSVSFPLFWPTSLNDPLKFGCYEIYLDESIHKEGYSIFRITINTCLKSFNSSHEFTVLHIKEWLEAGDASPSTVLSLVREYEKAQKGVKAPAIVMCSDGMGRTGTFISIVSEIERIKMEARSDVFQSVKAARNQRPYMVSTVVSLCFIVFNYNYCFP